MDVKLQYGEMRLPNEVDDILSSDFWIFEQLNHQIVSYVKDPVKFTSTVSIFIKKGRCRGFVNLAEHDMQAPCLINIKQGQILQDITASDDFEASFIVFSERLSEGVFACIHGVEAFRRANRLTCLPLSEHMAVELNRFYKDMTDIAADSSNPYRLQAFLYTTVSFFYKYAKQLYPAPSEEDTSRSHLVEEFLNLAQQYFRTERFLDFYAEKLGVSTRHIARMVKAHTGKTAGQWIEKMVVLEAKVLLKSSTLTVQQIADELNFPNPSFFCKYFKGRVGVSPRKYRYPEQ